MKAKTKADYSAIKKVIFKKGRVIMSVDEAARKVGCTRTELIQMVREHLENDLVRGTRKEVIQ